MGFLAPALPWIIKGGAALAGVIGGRKAQSSAMQRSPEEQAALGGATNTANTLTTTGTQLTGAGMGAVNPALSYYQTLLRGSRGAMANATAGPRGAITDTYRGAERGLEHSGVQGAGRDLATAELGRQKAGQIAGLTTGVQPAAAAALSDLGTNLTSQGGQQSNAAGSIWSSLLGQGNANRQYGRAEGEKAGTSIGGLLFDVLSSTIGKGKKPTFGMPGLPGGQAGPF